ncbi:hypothetical protein HMPREF9005_2032 [Actinomyces sp. oral taxon 178 str. F0338]|nr:hypothetical protein HMPREF9005_2032 [Actinomyces sp. oral taxon 178 str. F0338]
MAHRGGADRLRLIGRSGSAPGAHPRPRGPFVPAKGTGRPGGSPRTASHRDGRVDAPAIRAAPSTACPTTAADRGPRTARARLARI